MSKVSNHVFGRMSSFEVTWKEKGFALFLVKVRFLVVFLVKRELVPKTLFEVDMFVLFDAINFDWMLDAQAF